MKRFTGLLTLGLLAVFCMGASRCKKEQGANAEDTLPKTGDGLSDPGRPNDGFAGNGGFDSTVGAPDLPGLEVPDDGLLIERPDDLGFGANIHDPSRDQFEPVYFGFNQSALTGQERAKVENVANFLMSNQNASIIVEGHCDWKGTTEYNIALGERRASSVKEFLLAMGVSPNRVSVSSQGDLQAIEDADSAIMAKDRKARFIVVNG